MVSKIGIDYILSYHISKIGIIYILSYHILIFQPISISAAMPDISPIYQSSGVAATIFSARNCFLFNFPTFFPIFAAISNISSDISAAINRPIPLLSKYMAPQLKCPCFLDHETTDYGMTTNKTIH